LISVNLQSLEPQKPDWIGQIATQNKVTRRKVNYFQILGKAMLKQMQWLLFSFQGRLARSTFWWTCIWMWISFILLFSAFESLLGYGSTLILYPPLLWGLAALGVKRLHDRGKSFWWLLLLSIPVLGTLWIFGELALGRGSAGENQYGIDPTEHRHHYLTVS
jgi:uncharacterized membrane protein YhaH (DUF805 family)